MRQKKSLLAVLGTLTFACLFSAVAFMPKTATSAETEKITVENVLMEEGATVRVSGEGALTEKTGLRFNMYIDKATFDANTVEGVAPEVGMYVALTDDLTGSKNLTSMAGIQAIKDAKNFLGLAYMQEGVVTTDDTTNEVLEFRVVNELPVALYGKAITANGYIKIGDDYIFSTNPQSRSIAQISDIALDAGAENDDLTAFVNGALTEENFAFANTAFATDMYKDADLDVSATIPADLTATWESSDETVATVENGVITRVGEGTATISATIGSTVREATVTINKPNALVIDSENYKNVHLFDGSGYYHTYIENTEDSEIAGFAGDYTGNATKVKFGNVANGYRVLNPYSTEALNEIKLYYDKVSFWVAFGKITSTGLISFEELGARSGAVVAGVTTTLGMNWPNGYGFVATASAKKFASETWYKLTITMDQYISLLTTDSSEDSSYINLFTAWSYQMSSATDNMHFYFGNVEFESNLPYIVNIDSSTYSSVYLSGNTGASTYIAADADAIKDFAGDYNGNATKLTRYTTNHYYFKNCYSLEQLNAYKAKYSNVSLWMASGILTAGSARFYASGAMGNGATMHDNFVSKAGYASKFFVASPTSSTHLACGTWIKMTISIDDYIALVTDENGAVKDACALMGTWAYQAVGDTAIYIGDIFFE